MTRHPLPSDPEAAGASPPETKNARPGDGEGGSGEQSDTDTPPHKRQKARWRRCARHSCGQGQPTAVSSFKT